MGDYEHSQQVNAPAGQLLDYLCDVGNRQRLEWGSEGPDNYHGYLDVTGDAAISAVTVFLHTERHDSGEIDRGIIDTLAAVGRLVEAGPAPGPAR